MPPNIGGAINDAVRQLNPADDDWIIHVDQDVLFLLPDTKRLIGEILTETDFDVLGAMTNRLGTDYQLVSGMFKDTDITKHIECAKRLQAAHGRRVVQTKEHLAAFLLCFRYSTFKQLGGFVENVLNFDTIFSIRAHKMNKKLGIMWGVYVYHLYRLDQELGPSASDHYEHLLNGGRPDEKITYRSPGRAT